MKKRLSGNQAPILRAICDLSERQPWPSTVREIREETGVSSVSVVSYNMRILERMGYLSLTPRIARGVVITGRDDGVSDYSDGADSLTRPTST